MGLLRTAVLLLAGLAACGGRPRQVDRESVSREIEGRIGIAVGPGDGTMPPGVAVENGVTEDEAVAIALWNSPAFQEALADLGIARADIVRAGLLPNPILSLLFPLGPKQLEFAVKLPLEFLWLRPSRVAVAELEGERTVSLLVQGGLDLVRDVRGGFADLALAVRTAREAEGIARAREGLSVLARARLAAGEASELEAAEARAEALRARAEAEGALRESAIAVERLRGLLGLAHDPRPLRFEDARGEREVRGDAAALLAQALASRPDLRAAELGVEAAAGRAGLARWECLALTAILDANDRKGKDGVETGPGLEAPIPLFDRNQAGRARADAELERASRRYRAVRNRIGLEVRESHAEYQKARGTLGAFRSEVVPALAAAHEGARRAHEAGGTSLGPVLEAEERLGRARLEEFRAEAALRRARAQLERSVGRKLE
jgi:cobalt-zinc-cadmium efflux system outer membrane protein